MDKIIVKKINNFFSSNKSVSYKKGDTIIYATDEPTGIYFVKKGYVKMNTISVDGNEIILNIYKPGSFFPTFWAIGEKENNYSFEAMSNVNLFKTSKENFIGFLKENSDVLFDLTKRVLSGVDTLLTNITQLLVGSSEERTISAMLIISKRFGRAMQNGKIIIDLNLTHQDIANMIGTTRETASVVISKLTKKGYLEKQNGKFIINNLKK